jgi:hypothetical protein
MATPYAVDCTGLNDNQQLDEKLVKSRSRADNEVPSAALLGAGRGIR